MSLDLIDNISELERGVFSPFRGRYLESKRYNKASRSRDPSDFGNADSDFVEISVFDGDRLLLNQDVDKSFIKVEEGQALFNVGRHVQDANLSDGSSYILLYKFLRGRLGSKDGFKLFVEEVSPSGDEIRVSPVLVGNQNIDTTATERFNNFFSKNFESYTPDGKTAALKFITNFGNNVYYHIINWQVEFDSSGSVDSVILKLLNPVGDQITVGDEFWINEELASPYLDRFTFETIDEERKGQVLRGPNFSVDTFRNEEQDTGFQTWDSLIESQGDSNSTTQSLVNKFLNQDTEKIDLNVNYNEFNNFVKFSSAEERIKNFRYKLRVIQEYQKEIEKIQKDSPSYDSLEDDSFTSNILEENKQKVADTIDTFDNYEKWLFNADSNKYENTYPKEGGKLKDVNSTEAQEWFERIIKEASRYDEKNNDRLVNNIPAFIKEDPENDGFVLFLEMIGHFFDLMWIYIDHMKYISDRTEDINKLESLSKDLSQYVAKSFGFETYNGFDSQDLVDFGFKQGEEEEIEYVFSPLHGTGSSLDNYGESTQKVFPEPEPTGIDRFRESGENIQNQIWRRVLNTIPHLAKTKGTGRSISAILSAYGIPKSALTIREYGGTQLDHIDTLYEFTDETHSLGFVSGEWVEIPFGQPNTKFVGASSNWGNAMDFHRNRPNSIEVRFKSEYVGPEKLALMEIQQTVLVTAEEHSAFDKPWGLIRVSIFDEDGLKDSFKLGGRPNKDHPNGPLPIFDGNWNNFAININPEEYGITACVQKRSRFGNLMFFRKNGTGTGSFDNTDFPIFEQQVADTDVSNTDFPIFDETTSNLAQRFIKADNIYLGGRPLNLFESDPNNNLSDTQIPQGSLRQYYSEFNGDVDNVKLWKDPLPREQFDEHTLGPAKYDWNNEIFTKEDEKQKLYSKDYRINRKLIGHLDFTDAHDLTSDDTVYNESPNKEFLDNEIKKAKAVGYQGISEYPFQYDRYTRTNFIYSVKVGATALHSEKIRCEESQLLGTLSSDKKKEIGTLDEIVKDSPKLGIFFSPQKEINEDILLSIGVDNLNDLLGDPRDNARTDYRDLNAFNRKYWIKYPRPYDFEEYIDYVAQFNKAFFKQVRDLVPARVDLRDGLLIKPHFLERDKVEETKASLSREKEKDNIDLDVQNLTENSKIESEKRGKKDVFEEVIPDARDSSFTNVKTFTAFPDYRYAGNFDSSNDFQTKIEYTLEERFEDFDRTEYENAQDKEAYIESRTFNCSLRRVYRRLPFKEFVGRRIQPINNPEEYFHNNYAYFYGNTFVYGDPAAQSSAPYNGQPQYAGIYGICSFYSGGVDPIDKNLFIPDNFGGTVRKPRYPYARNRHYIYHREFRTSIKRMKYLGVVSDSSTSITGDGPVDVTFSSPDRLIVDPADQDESGTILEVE